MKLTEAQYEAAGKRLIEMLYLKPTTTKTRVGEHTMYATDWGTKTAAGLAKCMERIMDEASLVPPTAQEISGALDNDSANVRSLISQGR